jgi:hypothetical protein
MREHREIGSSAERVGDRRGHPPGARVRAAMPRSSMLAGRLVARSKRSTSVAWACWLRARERQGAPAPSRPPPRFAGACGGLDPRCARSPSSLGDGGRVLRRGSGSGAQLRGGPLFLSPSEKSPSRRLTRPQVLPTSREILPMRFAFSWQLLGCSGPGKTRPSRATWVA